MEILSTNIPNGAVTVREEKKPNSNKRRLERMVFKQCCTCDMCQEFSPSPEQPQMCVCSHAQVFHKVEKIGKEPVAPKRVKVQKANNGKAKTKVESVVNRVVVVDLTEEEPSPVVSIQKQSPPPPPPPPPPRIKKMERVRENLLLDKTPAATCPSSLLPELKRLPFTIRFVIEQLIAADDLSWKSITPNVVSCLLTMHNELGKVLEKLIALSNEEKGTSASINKGKKGLNLFAINAEESEAQRTWKNSDPQVAYSWKMGPNQTLAIACKVGDKIHLTGPFLEQSNRISRRFPADRLLRVGFASRTSASRKRQYSEIMERGIQIAGRNYEFLTYSASGTRDGKCIFFASSGDDIKDGITADKVRLWLGDFGDQPTLAKYGARMGQAFSKTIPTIEIPAGCVEEVDDIKRNGYIFTDGCGEISKDFMDQIATVLQLANTPSAVQIRYLGAKGVLAVNPHLTRKVKLVKSMIKFRIPIPTPDQCVIEVIKHSQWQTASLNRQFITLLHALGVPQELFLDLQKSYIDEIVSSSQDEDRILSFINFCETTSKTEEIKEELTRLLVAGNQATKGHSVDEPRVHQLVTALKKGELASLKKKSRIPLSNSALLLGVADQTAKLQYGQVFLARRVGKDILPVLGPVAVSKNPCLHPGDFRLLQAVNVPELYHLAEVLVFPTEGLRPHPNEISGGDLDGDQFFITWHPEIIKHMSPQNPMDYNNILIDSPLNHIPEDGRQIIPALKKLFLRLIANTSVGRIANLHQAIAEYFPEGANHNLCKELAVLWSRAIDAAKTGDIVVLDERFAKVVPGEPSFMKESMQNVTTSPHINNWKDSVIFEGILSKLYKQACDAYNSAFLGNPQLTQNGTKQGQYELVIDQDLVLEGAEAYMADARKQLSAYNRKMSKILLEYPQDKSTEKRRLIKCLNNEFRAKFEETVGWENRMRKASAWYLACYQKQKEKQESSSKVVVKSSPPSISFPWNTVADWLNIVKATTVTNRNKASACGDEKVLSLMPAMVSGSMLSKIRLKSL